MMKNQIAYELEQPISLHKQGRRSYNEDYIYPVVSSVKDRMFLVCDGVGGSTRGDAASKFVCEQFPALVKKRLGKAQGPALYTDDQQKILLNDTLKELEGSMSAYIKEHPNLMGMATTLTYLHLTPYGAVVAWAGDSRVYQIRGSEIRFVTEDHSLVNELVKRKDITPAEALTHPRRNVILRAISGTEPTRLDVKVLTDVQKGDYFILMTDGILDGIPESALLNLFRSNLSAEKMKEKIDQACVESSKDNYSMYLFRVKDLEKQPIPEHLLAATSAGAGTIVPQQKSNRTVIPDKTYDDRIQGKASPADESFWTSTFTIAGWAMPKILAMVVGALVLVLLLFLMLRDSKQQVLIDEVMEKFKEEKPLLERYSEVLKLEDWSDNEQEVWSNDSLAGWKAKLEEHFETVSAATRELEQDADDFAIQLMLYKHVAANPNISQDLEDWKDKCYVGKNQDTSFYFLAPSNLDLASSMNALDEKKQINTTDYSFVNEWGTEGGGIIEVYDSIKGKVETTASKEYLIVKKGNRWGVIQLNSQGGGIPLQYENVTYNESEEAFVCDKDGVAPEKWMVRDGKLKNTTAE